MAAALLDLILNTCPSVHIAPLQTKEIGSRFFRHVGVSPQNSPVFKRLDEAAKSVQVLQSKTKELDTKSRRYLSKIGSGSDFHLFEAARALDKLLLTNDPRLLAHREKLLKLTGGRILGYNDVLPSACSFSHDAALRRP